MSPDPKDEDQDLTATERQELHGALVELAAGLAEALAAHADRADVVDLDLPIGRLSRMDAMQQQAMAKAEQRRVGTRLGAVRMALERYADDPDDFGWCARCGERIPLPRLRLRPESPWCVPCLEARERG